MRIAEIGEFALIDRLRAIIGGAHAEVIVGVGDDVAVLADRDDEYLLATIDAQIETVHFLRHISTPHQIGRRALAINLSDIAAMGGRPQFALISLALPNDTPVEWVEELYRGLRAEADQAGVAVVGGNMTSAPGGVGIDVVVLGRVRPERLLLRSGARPGDLALVTGCLGDAAAGLRLALGAQAPLAEEARAALLARYLTPTARLREAAVIAEAQLATAMIDLSDGLSSDIGHICACSGVGARIWAERLPVSAAARQVAAATGASFWELALAGGDDYELCFTAPPAYAPALAHAVAEATGTPVTVVGEILPVEAGRRLALPGQREVALAPGGWEHFQRGAQQE